MAAAPTPAKRNTSDAYIALIALAAAVVLLRLPVWGFVSDGYTDEQLYALIGQKMNEGLWPFIDTWDRKPIGLFLIFAFSDLLPLPSPQNYQAVGGLFTLGGAFMLYRISRGNAGQLTSIGAGLLYILGMFHFGSGSGQSEVFHVPMMIAMFWLLSDFRSERFFERATAAMVIGGLALQVKYTVAPQCIFFGCVALWQLHRRGWDLPRLGLAAAGFAALGLLPTILAAATYWQIGHFEDFWFANIESSLLRESIGRMRSITVFALLGIILIVSASVLVRMRRRDTEIDEDIREDLAIGWMAAALGTTLIPGTFYFYYLATVVPALILVALPLLQLARGLVLLLVVAAVLLKLDLVQLWDRASHEEDRVSRLVKAIKPHVDSEKNCLWVLDGRTTFYQQTGSCLPTRFIYPDHLNNLLEKDSLPVPQVWEVERILASKPAVIVDADLGYTIRTKEVMDLVRGKLAQDYEKIAEEKVSGRTLSAWKLKDNAGD